MRKQFQTTTASQSNTEADKHNQTLDDSHAKIAIASHSEKQSPIEHSSSHIEASGGHDVVQAALEDLFAFESHASDVSHAPLGDEIGTMSTHMDNDWVSSAVPQNDHDHTWIMIAIMHMVLMIIMGMISMTQLITIRPLILRLMITIVVLVLTPMASKINFVREIENFAVVK